jgi:hypothetical protein
MDVYEVLRLLQLQKSDRAIAGALGINRKTVGKYRAWAAGQGLLAQRALPSREELHRRLTETWPGALPQSIHRWQFRDVISGLLSKSEVAAIFQRLGGTVTAAATLRGASSAAGTPAASCRRAHRVSGEEAQVDFGPPISC